MVMFIVKPFALIIMGGISFLMQTGGMINLSAQYLRMKEAT